MAASATTHQSPHVLVVPFPSHSHVAPLLSMATYMAAHGISLTIVQHDDAGLSQDAQQVEENRSIRYATLRSDFDPSQAFNRDAFFHSLSAAESKVTELLERLILEENPPVCLLIDILYPWSNGVALKFGLSRINLCASSASSLSMGLHIPDLVARGFLSATEEGADKKPIDFITGLPPLRLSDFPKLLFAEEGAAASFLTSMFDNVKSADRIVVNTMEELEMSVLEGLRRDKGLPIDPVGPLFMINTIAAKPSAHHLQKDSDSSCLSWLDLQQPSSVLYVAFGSLVNLEPKAVAELAYALEASGESFLWAIRRDKAPVEEVLPEGFMARIRGRGMVISWAPQLEVLAHRSVGGFLTHCGWNSVLESLSNGVPMLGFPQGAEQNSNLKFISEVWKVGLPLLPNEQFERGAMEIAIKGLMRGDDGLQIRMRARKWKGVAAKASQGSSKDNLRKLVDDLKHGKLNRSKH